MATPLTADLIQKCRIQFPALAREHDGQPAIFLDGPAGTQVTQSVIDAISHYYCTCNANHGGQFATSRESDVLVQQAHQALADFVGADNWREIVFGANMTSLTFAFSRAVSQTWSAGDNIVVTRLDHDANVSTWALAARDQQVEVRYADIHKQDCTLDVDDLKSKIDERTRLVAVGFASNSSGSINPVKEITAYAKQFQTQVFIDAVHSAPHRLIDVAGIGCDFLACSTYKFFGPHIGVLWAKSEILENLEAYKVRPSSMDIPDKWMTGTQNFASLCGSRAAVDYIADLGRTLADDGSLSRREALQVAYAAITKYEDDLCTNMIAGLKSIEGLRIHGITEDERMQERVPTVSVTHPKLTAAELANQLGERGIYAWDGNYYALELTEQLGLEPDGMVRLGLVHYNTQQEVDRLITALKEILA
ncbi:MAG: cysteine desulfurase-like protein [Planctomycetaceae bacterium]|nr:cysteine desulfurase-like protein [Planctomycetaceae bacterium]|tara:strand:- start:2757 stop:4019 length:1263 start_codon:yes stop_codon:yes gene_type:complete